VTVMQRAATLVRQVVTRIKAPLNLTPASSTGGWFTLARVRESYAGAWQNNVEVSVENVLTHPTVFACVTLIAFDVAKLRIKLVQQSEGDIWDEVENAAFSPVLRKPNRYQNRIQFVITWMLSKLVNGNTYVLKQRDNRGVVVALYVLDPNRVTVLVAQDGSVHYELKTDHLAEVRESQEKKRIVVPSSEIIHDVYIPLYHPLVGVSPIHAAGIAATQALHIQSTSTNFFANGAQPGGFLLHPGEITTQQAADLKSAWETNYSGENAGRVAVLGGGLQYKPNEMMSAVDAQVVEQLKWSDEKICSAYHVPGYKVGVGQRPPYNQALQLNQEYYSDCVQIHLEGIELLLDEALGLAPDKIDGRRLGTEFDLDNLLRMDAGALASTQKELVGGGISTPNEARRKMNLKPVTGGDTPYLQKQNYSLEALSKRDAQEDPFAEDDPKPPTPAAPEPDEDAEDQKQLAKFRLRRAIAERLTRAA
jgi:HK97 family phage portal protein